VTGPSLPFGGRSIRSRVRAVIMTTVTATLLVGYVALVLYDGAQSRAALVAQGETLCGIIADRTGYALAFRDSDAARDNLSVLASHPSVAAAAIFDERGVVFASYARGPAAVAFPAPAAWSGRTMFHDDALWVLRDVVASGQRVGAAALRIGEEGLHQRRRALATIVLTVLGGSLLIALLVAASLQRIILRPVQHLVEVARRISRPDSAPGVRASRSGVVELDVLADAFNGMLDQVEERDEVLRKTNLQLANQIEAHLRLHDRLRESEARLAQIIDFLPDATLAIDLTGKVIAWNRAMEQMTGIKAGNGQDGMLGKGDHEYALPFYDTRRPILVDLVLTPSSKVEQLYVAFSRVGDQIVGEGYASSERLAGTYLLGTAAPLYDAAGALIGAIECLRDISDRKRNEDAIRLVNARFASVLRAATAYSIIATGPTGTIEVMNEGAELMLGYGAAELLGQATPLVFHDLKEVGARAREQGVEPGVAVLLDKARRGEIDTREWTYRRRDGSALTVSLTVTAMRSEDGQLSGFICIARDVTGQKKLEQQLLQSQKMESVGLLSGGVAHDFNNLLTPIQGYADLLKDAIPADQTLQEYVEQIALAAESARELTYQLLAFSRKQLIELKSVDLGEIVRRSAKILRRTIRENVTLDFKLSGSLGPIRADASQIEVVLVNLAINAQDAMAAGGTLTIETSEVTLDEELRARHPRLGPGRYVRLAVSDTGSGMDEETMTRIFEPFFTTKELGKGTGLGLSTSYGIVTQHGGSIGVSSQVGRGSTFEILLPRLEHDAVPEAKPRLDAVARGSETILVVEDNQMVRDLLRRMLPELGYEALIVRSIDECQALLESRRSKIHLLLTDVVMPGLNGRELYERLRARVPGLKVLFMSGYTTDVIGHHGVLDEGVHFLRKPFTQAALSAKIREALT